MRSSSSPTALSCLMLCALAITLLLLQCCTPALGFEQPPLPSPSSSPSSSSSSALVPLSSPSVDPTICLRQGLERYDCLCHSCQCETCHSCGCSAKIFSSCSYDSCGSGCWCSGLGCRCCYNDDCRYECNCKQCCLSCYRTGCAESQTYSLSFLLPLEGPLSGGSSLVVHGAGFINTGEIQCRFGSGTSAVQTEGVWIDTGRVGCVSPPAIGGAVGAVPVEISLDGGSGWTVNNLQFTYSNCTSCSSNCEPGFAGSQCNLPCDASCIAEGHGKCLTVQDATGAEAAFCLCNQGYWTQGSDATHSCQQECPGGATNSCNGNGLCDGTTGLCDCAQSHFGAACENTCPGAIGTGASMKPCNGHGVCNAQGQCDCIGGYWGPDCATPCPGLLDTGSACKGFGVCNAANGTCSCNPPYTGDYCQSIYCPDPLCSGHGTCDLSTGNCVCEGRWSDPRCATPPPPSPEHGTIGFVLPAIDVAENAGTVQVSLQRVGGSVGSVTAICSTVSGSALAGADFFPFSNLTVSWADGDFQMKNLSVIIIQDTLAEPAESFSVRIDSLQGLAILDTSHQSITINIAASSSPPEVAQVSLQVDKSWSSLGDGDGQAQFMKDFATQMSQALSVSSVNLVAVQSIAPTAGGQEILVQFLLFSDTESGGSNQRVTSLVDKMLQAVGLLPSSGLFSDGAAYPILSKIDPDSQPVVLMRAVPDPVPSGGGGDQPSSGGSKGWVAVLVIVLVLVLLCAILGAGAYIKRVALSEWILFKVGRFRFSRFKNQPAGEGEGESDAQEADEEGGSAHEQRSGSLAATDSLSPAAGNRKAKGGPTELALRREEGEQSGGLLVD